MRTLLLDAEAVIVVTEAVIVVTEVVTEAVIEDPVVLAAEVRLVVGAVRLAADRVLIQRPC